MGSLFSWAHKLYLYALKHIGWFLVATISIVGITLFVWGKYTLSTLTPPQTNNWAEIAAGLGTLLCASGVSGAVLKLIATEGFFKDAVAEVVHGEGAMARLSEASLVETWGLATRMLYLKNMTVSGGGDKVQKEIDELRGEVSRAVKARFPSSVQFFSNRSVRHISIKWHDKDQGLLYVEDTVDFLIIPFNPKEPLKINTRIKAWANCNIDDYNYNDASIKLINGNASDLECNISISDDKTTRNYEYLSKPRDQHHFLKKTSCVIPVLKDPNWHSISSFIIRSADVHIWNNAEGLAVIFNTLGDDTLFRFIDGGEITNCGEKFHFSLSEDRTILPGNGYGFTFVPTK